MSWLLLMVACWGLDGTAPSFAPLSPSVWDTKNDVAQGIFDAVIIRDEYEIAPDVIRRYRCLRILSEDGKFAADFEDISGNVKNIQGRVVTRDGQEITFDETTDLIETLVGKHHRNKLKLRQILPPGITQDCVVEMRWEIEAEQGLPRGTSGHRYDAAEAYYVQHKVFRVDARLLAWDNQFSFRKKFQVSYTQGQAPITFEHKEDTLWHTYKWSNIPPRKFYPYGNAYLDNTDPYFRTRKVPYWTNSSDYKKFWQLAMGLEVGKPLLSERVGKFREYRAFVKQLKAEMPEDPVEAMEHIYHAFNARILDLKMLKPGQDRNYKPLKKWDNTLAQRLDMAFKQGYANRFELAYLFTFIARDCGVPFKLVYPGSLQGSFFVPQACFMGNINLATPYIMVESEEKRIFIAAHMREYPFGMIPSIHKGAHALTMEPSEDYTVDFIRIPIDDPSLHTLTRQHQIKIDKKAVHLEADHFWSGELEAGMRRIFLVRDTADQRDLIVSQLEAFMPDWQLREASFTNAYELNNPLSMKIQAQKELEDFGTGMIVLDPFPTAISPLQFPSNWPAGRSQPIVLDRAFTVLDESLIEVPPGYTLRGNNSWQQENPLGSVSILAQQEGDKIMARRQIVLKRNLDKASNEILLQQFLGWAENAFNQQLALERGGQF